MKKSTYVVANWKMNPQTVEEARSIFAGIKRSAAKYKEVTTIVCPPFVYMSDLHKRAGSTLALGVQNVHEETHGAYTGDVSAGMARSAGARYVIAGHSERRFPREDAGERDAVVNKKVLRSLEEKLTPILCIGERERDDHGRYLSVIQDEIRASLKGVDKKHLKQLIIAYEPIWAIGKRAEDAMQPRDVHETVLFIRKTLSEDYGKVAAVALPILYGGSVEAENAGLLMDEGGINGFLVGHASLDPQQFGVIIESAS